MSGRNLNKNSEQKPSRGRVFHNGSGGPAPKLQFRARSATVVKNTSGSGFLSSEFLFKSLLCILPLVLYFSYYPVIKFGASESMNFELSLPLIWLALFDLVVVVLMGRKGMLFKGFRKKLVWLLFPVWLSLSVLWSLNFIRGALTVGILWLIYLAVDGMWSLRKLYDEKFRRCWWKWFWGASLVACGWCILQCILDVVGVGREYSLMCAGCTYHMFGFPHPNGFAIEPQFMGNLLLAPAVVAMWRCVMKPNSKNLKPKRSRGIVLTTGQADSAPNCSLGSSSVPVVKTTTGSHLKGFKFLLLGFIVIFTLFLTLSRGAIYAFLVAMVFASALVLVREKKERGMMVKRVVLVWGVAVVSFLLALNFQGILAQASPTDDTYMDGVARSIDQLSLGTIDIRGGEKQEGGEPVENPVENSGDRLVENSENNREESAIFDGYVAESTETRLKLTNIAIMVWKKDFGTACFGVGLGGAGQALYVNNLTEEPKEIVQNEYASLLLETGVVGVSLLVLTLVLVVRVIWKRFFASAPLILTLLVAYAVTLLFFSGLPNALQIYLLPGVIAILSKNRE